MSRQWVKVGGGDFFKWTEQGQVIEGIWRGQKDGKFGSLGIVDTFEGKRINFPLHTVLLNRVDSLRVGAEIRIVYLGKETGKSGTQYKAFDLFVSDEKDLVDPVAEKEEESPF